jgi:hypothetical protein
MRFPAESKPAAWGAVGGAVLTMIVGFGFGGWVTLGTAERETGHRVQAAVVSVLAPICADRFLQQTDVAATLAELHKASSWGRDSVVANSGFAAMPGSTDAENGVTRACAEILAKTKD